MLFSCIIRRTASRVVPCASRLVQRRRHFSTPFASHSAAATSSYGAAAVLVGALRRYSTIPKPDKALIKVIESEVQCLVDSCDRLADKARNDFPFEIEENPARETMILRREFKGEQIEVEVYMPNLVAQFGEIPLTVKVFKKSGVYLEFAACYDENEDIAIVNLTVNDPKIEYDPYSAKAPPFRDLDDNLQKAFHKYLERRKINPHIIKFLQKYTVDKDTKEYSNWFNTVKHFVKSDSEDFPRVGFIMDTDGTEYMNWLHDIKKFVVESDSN